MSEPEAYLAAIRIYPIKSLDPVPLEEAALLPVGALDHDREFALRDAEGRFVNAKRFASVQRLRTSWNLSMNSVSVCSEDSDNVACFRLPEEQSALEAWMTDYFGQPVSLAQNAQAGFPDDTKAPGPTVISTATLEAVASWFPGLTLEEARRRFRANLEIGGVPPFWEDRLYADIGEAVPFCIGDTLFHGVNPCQRCIVPTRNSRDADVWPDFAQVFQSRRETLLPAWANRSRFNHFYRLAVNTQVPGSDHPQILRIGDAVILDPTH